MRKLSHYAQAEKLTRREKFDHILKLQIKINGCRDVVEADALSRLGRKYSARLYWAELELAQYRLSAKVKGNLIVKR